jgi:serine/threonine protein kinase
VAFLSALLQRDPATRATAAQLLAHPWVLQHCGGHAAPLAAAMSAPAPPLALPLPPLQQQGSAPLAGQGAWAQDGAADNPRFG